MDNINEFKSFVKKHPNLNSYVTDGQMTWQKFYEMYDMYGEDSEVWQSYKTKERKTTSLTDIVNMAKNVDVDKLQDGIGSLQKALTILILLVNLFILSVVFNLYLSFISDINGFR